MNKTLTKGVFAMPEMCSGKEQLLIELTEILATEILQLTTFEQVPDPFLEKLFPHHVPDEIIAIEEVPRTLNGQKTEVPVKKLFLRVPVEKAVSRDALANPHAIEFFIDYVEQAHAEGKAND